MCLPEAVEFWRRIAILHRRDRNRGGRGTGGAGTRRTKVNQRDPVRGVHPDVIGCNVAVQDAIGMNVADRLQRFPQGCLEKRRCKPLWLVVQNRDQIYSVHIVEGHIGGVVLLENLMNGDDIGMFQRRHAARLAQELLFQRRKLRLGLG